LWHADPLLRNDCEISKYTTAITNGFTNKHVCMATMGKRNGVFCAVLPRCYKGDSWLRVASWSKELLVGQTPAGKNMSMAAEDIVEICH
jgi:hypothetical protein